MLAELRGWRLPRGMAFAPVRLTYSLAPNPGPFDAEPGGVCVLDACFPPATTEALLVDVVAAHPGLRVVMVTEDLAVERAVPLLRRGAKGILPYEDARRQLPSAVGAVSSGGVWVPRAVLSAFLDGLRADRPSPPPRLAVGGLSKRETHVLDGLLRHESNKEIASRLAISERTVKFHVSNILAKFSVQRRADLILLSLQPAADAG